jgi:polyhydroxyalkanoate synthesis regulator phasin
MASVREELIDRLVDEYDIQRQDATRAVDLVLEDEENTRYENSDFNIALNEDIEEAADWIYNQNKYWKHLNP